MMSLFPDLRELVFRPEVRAIGERFITVLAQEDKP
jgi:hypothetical protein